MKTTKNRFWNPALALLLAAALGAAAMTAAQKSNAADVQLQAAIHKQTVEGDLEQAIRMYKDIVSKYSANHAVAASALLHMGQAYEKLGSAEARNAYEQVALEYADQKEVAADAGRRLATLGSALTSAAGPRRLVLSNGDNVDQASISADGRWMALAFRPSGGAGLVVRDMSSGQDKQLRAGCQAPCPFAEDPILSPDVRQVAYTWYDDREIGGRGQLRIIANETGAIPRVLVRNAEFGAWPHAWSPDGKSLLVTVRHDPDRTWQIAWVSVVDGSMKVLKSLGWRLAGGQDNLKLSPDGRYIAYAALAANPSSANDPLSVSADRNIYILAVDGATETALTKTSGISASPVWTPDGAHLLFTSNFSRSFDLWSVAIKDGEAAGSPSLVKRDIGSTTSTVTSLAITRSGSYYYARSQQPVWYVSIGEITSGTAPVQTPAGRINERVIGSEPAWSPDGKFLAFTRNNPRGGENYDLIVRSIGTGEEETYVQEGLQEGLTWLNNGKSLLVYIAGRGLQLWDLNTRVLRNIGAEIRATVQDFTLSNITALSQDDKLLYVAAREAKSNSSSLDRIVALDLTTLKLKQVFKLPEPGSMSELDLSPDGRTLAFAVIHGGQREQHLSRVGIDGSDYRELYTPFQTIGTPAKRVRWSKDGKAILFLKTTRPPLEVIAGKGGFQIMKIPADGGLPVPLSLEEPISSTFDLSPDGSHVAYSGREMGVTELLVMDNVPSITKATK